MSFKQEFLFLLNRKNNNLVIWDLALEHISHNIDLQKLMNIPVGEIEYIYTELCDMKSGLIIIDSNSTIYDFSLS